MGQVTAFSSLQSEQSTADCEIAQAAKLLGAAREKLKLCIAPIDVSYDSSTMRAQQVLHLRNKREQLRSAAAKMKRAQDILTSVSECDVNECDVNEPLTER